MNVLATKSKTSRTELAVDKFNKLAMRWLTQDEISLIFKSDKQRDINKYAGLFYILHKEYGFTGEQLIEFYNKYFDDYTPIINQNFSASLENIPEVELLKDIGVDLEIMYKEGFEL